MGQGRGGEGIERGKEGEERTFLAPLFFLPSAAYGQSNCTTTSAGGLHHASSPTSDAD